MVKGKVKNKKWYSPKIVFKIFSFFLILLYIQLVYLSISKKIYGKNMTEFASSRNTVKQTIKANRGTVYDKNEETLSKYYDEEVKVYQEQLENRKNYLMIFMGIVAYGIIIIIIISLIRGKNKKRRHI